MCVRAVVVFVFGLVVIRLFARKAFGMQTPLDIVLAIVVGSNLSRTLTGEAPFLPTLAATAVLAAMFWLFNHLAIRWGWFGRLVKGIRSRWRATAASTASACAASPWAKPIWRRRRGNPGSAAWTRWRTPFSNAAARSAPKAASPEFAEPGTMARWRLCGRKDRVRAGGARAPPPKPRLTGGRFHNKHAALNTALPLEQAGAPVFYYSRRGRPPPDAGPFGRKSEPFTWSR